MPALRPISPSAATSAHDVRMALSGSAWVTIRSSTQKRVHSQIAGEERWAASTMVSAKASLKSVGPVVGRSRSEEHTSELQSPDQLVCRLLLEKKKRVELSPAHV